MYAMCMSYMYDICCISLYMHMYMCYIHVYVYLLCLDICVTIGK